MWCYKVAVPFLKLCSYFGVFPVLIDGDQETDVISLEPANRFCTMLKFTIFYICCYSPLFILNKIPGFQEFSVFDTTATVSNSVDTFSHILINIILYTKCFVITFQNWRIRKTLCESVASLNHSGFYYQTNDRFWYLSIFSTTLLEFIGLSLLSFAFVMVFNLDEKLGIVKSIIVGMLMVLTYFPILLPNMAYSVGITLFTQKVNSIGCNLQAYGDHTKKESFG